MFIRQASLQQVGKARLRAALTSVHVIQLSDDGYAGKRNAADHLAKKKNYFSLGDGSAQFMSGHQKVDVWVEDEDV